MNYNNIYYPDLNTQVDASIFTRENGVSEIHLMIKPDAKTGFANQMDNLQAAWERRLKELNIEAGSIILKRFFMSDLVNQYPLFKEKLEANTSVEEGSFGVSIVEQPPLPDNKIVMWAYHIIDEKKEAQKYMDQGNLVWEHNNCRQIWTTQMVDANVESSFDQMDSIFKSYTPMIESYKLSLRDDVIRTWIYVQNVDANYEGVVISRRELFEKKGLTKESNFITSTGIEGRFHNPAVKVSMDALAVAGLEKGQVQFLNALDHLNPTHEYGVTFERGTTVEYGDRKQIFISGTASIDNKGEVVHVGDVYQQMHRAIDNIEALLRDTQAELSDLAKIIVYLRDQADYQIVDQYLINRFKGLPYVIVWAPVCRPGWLIEIEGIALTENLNENYKNF
jgi:enamine deaminase RidA (YjgF/YER057c/UK114 family)